MAEAMKKKEFLEHWHGLEAHQPVNPEPVPYKHQGSTYDQDGIRITGSREFVESVLSRMKDLLRFEGPTTRLQVVFKETVDRETGVPTGTWNCYVQVHERGREAAYVNSAYGAVTYTPVGVE